MINLNVHSCYEFLGSNIKIDQLLEKLSRDDQQAVAITDFNRMHGVYQVLRDAPLYNIKPLIGMEITVDDGLAGIPLITLAKNEQGYKSLIRLSAMLSYKSLERTPHGYLAEQLTDCAVIAKTAEGIDVLKSLERISGEDKYTSHEVDDDTFRAAFIHTAYYMEKRDIKALKVLNAIRDNVKIDPEALSAGEGENHVLLQDDLSAKYDQYMDVNEEIISKCDVPLPESRVTLPRFPHSENIDSPQYLWQQLIGQLDEKTPATEEYKKRMIHEFNIIKEMGYADYFLIVSDTVNYAKNNDIYVGPGRGSSSASLVSYLLNITEMDPLKYNLLFERFLNPARVTMPDIDIDFEDTKRDQVVSYLIDKYGQMNVANIVTYGTLSAKMATRDAGRVFGFSEEELKMLSGMIPDGPNVSLDALFSKDAFKQLKEHDDKYKVFQEVCRSIEGLPRHTSTHAAGVLLSEEKLTTTIPIMFSDGHTLSQWPMGEVEAAGLLKIDALGLRNLSLIRHMASRVKRTDEGFDVNHLPNDDSDVYKVLSKGLTLGIFQLESDGIRKVIQEVVPVRFLDLAAVLALYRPGPMKEIPNFVKGKHHPDTVTYPHEDIGYILEETYGVIVYQEQIMLIASKVAGYSFAEADILRRAMSKKDRDALLKEEERFIEGATGKGYNKTLATHIFNLILEFADYGFPKSHAVAYSQIAYVLAYIKTKYPAIFYAVILLHHSGNEEKTRQVIDEMTKMKVAVTAPDINTSRWTNTENETGRTVKLGLSMIGGMTYKAADAIVKERQLHGDYTDIFDLKTRVTAVKITQKMMRHLIISGTLDDFRENRKTMLQTIPKLEEIDTEGFAHESFLSSLGFSVKKEFTEASEMTDMELIEGEKEALGFYISEHPVKLTHRKLQFLPFNLLGQHKKAGTYLLYITGIKVIKTKKGQNMAFATVNDGGSEMDAVIFPSVYFKEHRKLQNPMLIIEGRIEERDDEPQLIVQKLSEIDEYKENYISQVGSVLIRNQKRYEFNDLLKPEGVKITSFETKEILGYIERESLQELVSRIDPHDIRLMRK